MSFGCKDENIKAAGTKSFKVTALKGVHGTEETMNLKLVILLSFLLCHKKSYITSSIEQKFNSAQNLELVRRGVYLNVCRLTRPMQLNNS